MRGLYDRLRGSEGSQQRARRTSAEARCFEHAEPGRELVVVEHGEAGLEIRAG
jgi:hypothetical protein